jgi:hypothetical protein
MNTDLDRWRDWFERQAQPQPDGSILIRPFGWLGGVYALPDVAAKDRYIAAQLRWMKRWRSGHPLLFLPFVVPVVAAMLTIAGIVPIGLVAGWAAAGAAFMLVVLPIWTVKRTLRHTEAKRVPHERWIGPAIRDPFSVSSCSLLLYFAIALFIWGAVGIQPVLDILALDKAPGVYDLVIAACGTFLLASSVVYFRAFYRRARGHTPESGGHPG